MINLTPAGRESFRLPPALLPLTLFIGREKVFEKKVAPDTVLLDTENRRFSLVWRIQQRIRRTILDFTECWIGPPTQSMLRARETGRRYIRANGIAPEEESEDA